LKGIFLAFFLEQKEVTIGQNNSEIESLIKNSADSFLYSLFMDSTGDSKAV
jgi:hypothetical protein